MKQHRKHCYFREITCHWINPLHCRWNKPVAMSQFAEHLTKYHNCHVSPSHKSARLLNLKLTMDGESFAKVHYHLRPKILKKDGNTFLIVVYIYQNFVKFWAARKPRRNIRWSLSCPRRSKKGSRSTNPGSFWSTRITAASEIFCTEESRLTC
ncbi:uncharacterized protein LOC118436806 [Folsomia candida]|uniref:uncharacterized protein LOC118436806 n=1 Tax=Folsomia candida TaxID=158441 RepID=UPI00160525D4|nr:uncharacterized protein LOC118436806 [Folsomia candida]